MGAFASAVLALGPYAYYTLEGASVTADSAGGGHNLIGIIGTGNPKTLPTSLVHGEGNVVRVPTSLTTEDPGVFVLELPYRVNWRKYAMFWVVRGFDITPTRNHRDVNNNALFGGDYITVNIIDGKPQLSMNFGYANGGVRTLDSTYDELLNGLPHLLGVQYDGASGAASIWIDGVEDALATFPALPTSTPGTSSSGPYCEFIDGEMAHWGVFNDRVLTATQWAHLASLAAFPDQQQHAPPATFAVTSPIGGVSGGSSGGPTDLAGQADGVATVSGTLSLPILAGAFSPVACSSAASVDGQLRRVGIPTRILKMREAAREDLDPTGLTGVGV